MPAKLHLTTLLAAIVAIIIALALYHLLIRKA